MPSISTILAPQFQTSFFRAKCSRITSSLPMTTDSDFLNNKKKQVSLQLPSLAPHIPRVDTVTFCDLRFDRSQPSDEELEPHERFEFGKFVARKAIVDVEFWTAAWLRAESEWEDPRHTHTQYDDYCKRKFAEQEYNAMKDRTRERQANCESSTCIITVRKKLKNVKRSIIKSVVATLDLNIQYLLIGETFPGERVDPPRFCFVNRSPSSRYGYIANLCVAKSARHQGIAINMLHFAVEYAKSKGVARVYIHVERDNEPAQIMYQSLGFELVDMANPLLIQHQTYLLCLQM